MWCLRCTGTSLESKELVNLNEWVKTLDKNRPVVFVVGAIAHGHVTIVSSYYSLPLLLD